MRQTIPPFSQFGDEFDVSTDPLEAIPGHRTHVSFAPLEARGHTSIRGYPETVRGCRFKGEGIREGARDDRHT